MSFGWWTTGRDEAALALLRAAHQATQDGTVPSGLSYVFCSREPGESAPSDALLSEVAGYGLTTVTLSAARFEPGLRKADRQAWREAYHREVLARVSGLSADLVVLAGYMWVVSVSVCKQLSLINLHPAAPGGPVGTWQEVIWRLLSDRARETGVMMHLVTAELDKGPPVTYCTFPIRGGPWEPLWAALEEKRADQGLEAVQSGEGEGEPLFGAIRLEGVRRELPLIVQTLRSFALGKIAVRNGALVDARGKNLARPYDLTGAIERMLKKNEPK